MEGAARRVVHGLKYRGVRELAPLMAAAMAPLGQRVPFDGALAIPLHRSRLRDRGFNQAELLLENLGWQPCEGRLIRHKKTETQVGMHEHERRRNVDDAFAYEGPRLDGRSLALVDDVITTGSTAVECGRVLREHGARHVYIFAYTRANFRPGSRPDD
jgi:ComF family protein